MFPNLNAIFGWWDRGGGRRKGWGSQCCASKIKIQTRYKMHYVFENFLIQEYTTYQYNIKITSINKQINVKLDNKTISKLY